MGFVRALSAHGLRSAVRAGGDGRGGAGQSRLARLADVRADPRGHGLCAHLRHGVQSHRRSRIRRAESAHGQPPSAHRPDFPVQRLAALPVQRRGLDCGQLFSESAVFLSVARRAGGDLLLFAHEAVHGLHARFSRRCARARARGRMAGGKRRERFHIGNLANDHARAGGRAVARRLRHHLRVAGLRIRQIARPALARCGVGTKERASRRRFSRTCSCAGCCWRSVCSAGFASRISSAG